MTATPLGPGWAATDSLNARANKAHEQILTVWVPQTLHIFKRWLFSHAGLKVTV
ncbi:hypothetical protein J3458_008902 [Metarhizium acridum]|uniref:uncharacterized protein n=1 Tax=Metarhizium acridum TaxID=92637 RepID=UPI001C6B5EE0|nr:hypothetical protein J3458_008902 [Metarhizium acridum]